MRQLCRITGLAALFLFAFSGFVLGQDIIYVDNSSLVLVSTKRVTRTQYDYTYKAVLQNCSGKQLPNARATVRSFTPGTQIIEGDLSFSDTPAFGSSTSDDTFTIRQDRVTPFDPQNLVWDVQYEWITIKIEQNVNQLSIPVGTSSSLEYTVLFESNTTNEHLISLNQTVSPNPEGISIQFDAPPEWTVSGSNTRVINANVRGLEIDVSCDLVTTAKIEGIGQSESITARIDISGLKPLGSLPNALPVLETKDVLFTTRLSNSEPHPEMVELEECNEYGDTIRSIGYLVDDGTNGDLQAEDYVYSGIFNIGPEEEGKLYYRAMATFSEITEPSYSEIYCIPVTRFPTECASSNTSEITNHPETGQEMLCDRILVSFKEGATPESIEGLVESVNGTIIGTILGGKYFQVKIEQPGNATNLLSIISYLKSLEIVETAGPSFIAHINSVSDTNYGYQWNIPLIGADSAWIINRASGSIIAILDTGIDYNHPDLSQKVIRGKDFYNNDIDPIDDNGHGTHVAGIAAASTNNEYGIAGISFSSRILAIKVANKTGALNYDTIAAGLDYAVGCGVQIINCSFGFRKDWASEDSFKLVEDAIKRAAIKGCLIIAAAGNDHLEECEYPAAYDGVLAVGATDLNDNICYFSNFGNRVDIAAPGFSIYSTMPTYPVYLTSEEAHLPNFDFMSGTSMAAPHVSGAAALVWSRYPTWSAQRVKERICNTVKPLPGLQLGAGRLDVFNAVFNGNFGDGLSGWDLKFRVTHGDRGGYTSTGTTEPSSSWACLDAYLADSGPSIMRQHFYIPPEITSVTLTFDWFLETDFFDCWLCLWGYLRPVCPWPNGCVILDTEALSPYDYSSDYLPYFIYGIPWATDWPKPILKASPSFTFQLPYRENEQKVYLSFFFESMTWDGHYITGTNKLYIDNIRLKW